MVSKCLKREIDMKNKIVPWRYSKSIEQQISDIVKVWDYFLEDYDGNVLKYKRNVPYNEAPTGAEYDDKGEIVGYWHPMEP